MQVTPPIAGINIGASAGGGLLSSITEKFTGGASQAPKQADGSVGLMDGVIGKAALGGAAGAALGFIPFIPGGPILGGIVGALGGAALGMYKNWKAMNAIKAQNEAMMAALGVQVQDPMVQQVLQSGNVEQLIPLMQQAGVQQSLGQQQLAQQQAAAQQQVAPQQTAAQGAGGTDTTQASVNAGMSGALGYSGGAVDTSYSTNADMSDPYTMLYGGGSSAAADAAPPAPVDPAAPKAEITEDDVAAIAPLQAGVGDAVAGVAKVDKLTTAQLSELITQLQHQVDMLKNYLEEQRRIDDQRVENARMNSSNK